MYANNIIMSESVCGQLSMCNHTLGSTDSSVTLMVERGVDLTQSCIHKTERS